MCRKGSRWNRKCHIFPSSPNKSWTILGMDMDARVGEILFQLLKFSICFNLSIWREFIKAEENWKFAVQSLGKYPVIARNCFIIKFLQISISFMFLLRRIVECCWKSNITSGFVFLVVIRTRADFQRIIVVYLTFLLDEYSFILDDFMCFHVSVYACKQIGPPRPHLQSLFCHFAQ